MRGVGKPFHRSRNSSKGLGSNVSANAVFGRNKIGRTVSRISHIRVWPGSTLFTMDHCIEQKTQTVWYRNCLRSFVCVFFFFSKGNLLDFDFYASVIFNAYCITAVRTYVRPSRPVRPVPPVRPVRNTNGFRAISFEKISVLDWNFIHRYIIIKCRSSST